VLSLGNLFIKVDSEYIIIAWAALLYLLAPVLAAACSSPPHT
jgi:hypothetical protein